MAGVSGVDFVEHGKKPLLLIDSETGVANEQEGDSIPLKPFELVDFRILETRFNTKSSADLQRWKPKAD